MERKEAIARLEAHQARLSDWRQDLHELHESHEDDRKFACVGLFYPEYIKHMGQGVVLLAHISVDFVRMTPLLIRERRNNA